LFSNVNNWRTYQSKCEEVLHNFADVTARRFSQRSLTHINTFWNMKLCKLVVYIVTDVMQQLTASTFMVELSITISPVYTASYHTSFESSCHHSISVPFVRDQPAQRSRYSDHATNGEFHSQGLFVTRHLLSRIHGPSNPLFSGYKGLFPRG
jgi:hypothetical protein